MSNRFKRRSLLYVPGSSVKMLEKAINIDVDSIIIDLEDAVSMSEKDSARVRVSEYIPLIRETGKETVVRVNGMTNFYGVKDLIAIVEARPHTVIIPKADVLAVKMADTILSGLEEHHGIERGDIGIIPLLETADGIIDAASILKASPRVDGVQLGAEDLTKELSIRRTPSGEEISYARHALAYAACSCGVDCIDTPFTGIGDLNGLEYDANTAASIGFTGKTCIHPSHIETIDRVFSPTDAEIDHARRLIETFEEAIRQGKGACMFEGKMIDNPIAERAQKLLSKAGLL